MDPTTFTRTISSLEKVLEHADPIFLRPRKELRVTGGFSLQLQEVEFNIDNFQKIVRNMIADYTFYLDDPKHETVSLKNTNIPKSMLLDGLKSQVNDYFFLQCLVINEKNVVFHFKDPLDLDAISTLIDTAKTPYKINITHTKTKKGSPTIDVSFDDVTVLKIDPYNVIMPYDDLVQENKLSEFFRASTELVTRIHQDRLFNTDRTKIYLSNYLPIFKLVAPNAFDDVISDVLKIIKNASLSGDLPVQAEFIETKKSKLYNAKNKLYRLNLSAYPDHINYIVACPDKQELYIRFGANLDYNKISTLLKERNCYFDDQKTTTVKHSVTIQKGGGCRTKIKRRKTTEKDVLDENGNVILTLEGNNGVKLYFNQDEKTFDVATKLFSDIYYGRTFYTGWVPTSELNSDLTSNERIIITSIQSLEQIYNTLLSVDDIRDALAKGKPVPKSSLDWTINKLTDANGESFDEKVLYVLNYIDSKVDPNTFYKFGTEEVTQESIKERYSKLQNLKGRFEALVKARKAGLLV